MKINYGDLPERFRNWIYFKNVEMSDLQYHSIYNTRFDHLPHLRIVNHGGHYHAGVALVAHGDSFGIAMSPNYWKLTFTSEMLNIHDINREYFVPSPVFDGNEQAFERDLTLLVLTQYAYTVGSFRGSVG